MGFSWRRTCRTKRCWRYPRWRKRRPKRNWKSRDSTRANRKRMGFNFNDTPFPTKRNLYHVIYTGEHVDYIYNDLSDAQILGWASHVKCKNSNAGRFSGRIHTHDLVAVVNPYEARKRVYDKANLSDRMQCDRCRSPTIKVKLVNSNSYFINVAKYLISIYTEEQVTVGEFTYRVDGYVDAPPEKPKKKISFTFANWSVIFKLFMRNINIF